MARSLFLSRIDEFFLSSYQGLPYSDRARIKAFVNMVLCFLVASVAAMPLLFLYPNLFTRVFALLLPSFLVILLFLIRHGKQGWSEVLTAGLLPFLFIGLVYLQPKVQSNALGSDFLLTLCLFNLVLLVMLTTRSRGIVITGVIYLVAGLYYRLVFQVSHIHELDSPAAIPPTVVRFLALDSLTTLFLVMVQRIIRRANRLADEALARLEATNQVLKSTVEDQSKQIEHITDRLRTSQRVLSEGEKLSTVGRFVAGIAHEINTPLAAIESSASNLQERIQLLCAMVFSHKQGWTQEDFDIILEVLEAADLSGLNASSKDQRDFRKSLPSDLPPGLADGLAYWGVQRLDPKWLTYLTSSRGPVASELLAGIVELHRSAAIVTVASTKAAVYVRELKKFVSKDSSKSPAQVVTVTDSLDTFLLLYQNQLRGRIEVTKDYPTETLQVRGISNQILQIWSNLITNAVGAMGESGRLDLTVRRVGREVEIVIADNGPGIPEAIQSRIFEPFFSTKAEGEGLGLGLEIAKSIVDEYQGTMHFESQPGRTVFTVRLPLAVSSS